MKRFFLIGTIVFCLAVLAIIGELVRRAFFEEKGSPSHLHRIVAQINARVPEEAGEGVDLIGAERGDRLLTVRYQLYELTAAEVDSVELRAVRETLREKACSKDAFRELLDQGVTLRYVFVDADEQPVLTTDILRWECGGLATAPSSR